MAILNAIILLLALGLLFQLNYKKLSLSIRCLVGLILGVGFGLLLKFSYTGLILDNISSVLYLIGHGYLALLKMLVIPLILTSIIHAIVNLGKNSTDSLKRLSFFSCAFLLGLTALSSLIGIWIARVFAIGQGMELSNLLVQPKHTYKGFADTLLHMLPSNPVEVMANENTIAVVIFAVLLGLAARMLDEADHDKMETFRQLIVALFAIVKKLATLVLRLTPYGIFGLISLVIYDQGFALLTGMLNFIAAMYVAMALVIVVHSLLVMLMGYSPWVYFKKAFPPLFVAFTTRSSFGTLPVTEETLRDQFKTSQVTATFVPSIGATIGMNACAGVYPAMLVVMTMTILHQPLTWSMIAMIMFINTIASLGISGIPGTAYIAATVTLTSLNLPYAIVGLVQGIDPIVDMGRTATNVNGVITTSLLVDKLR